MGASVWSSERIKIVVSGKAGPRVWDRAHKKRAVEAEQVHSIARAVTNCLDIVQKARQLKSVNTTRQYSQRPLSCI
jgi:hypothetical protein